MSGRGKRTLYYVVTVGCLLAALAACVLMDYAAVRETGEIFYPLFSFLLFCGVQILFVPCVLVHECGHLFFGACAGLKPISVRVGYLWIAKRKARLAFSSAAGKTELVPRSGEKLRGRMTAAFLGGATFNFIFGAALIVLFFVLPVHPVLLFFELFAPFHLCEGIAALLPAELGSGCTDGEMLRRIRGNTPEAQVFLSVLCVQGILQKNTFDEVDESLLFGLPVVREDEPAFLSLLHLRWQFLMWNGEIARAATEISRLEELSEYLDEYERAQVVCDGVFTRRVEKGESKEGFVLPAAAKGTCSYLRAELALKGGDSAQYKKIAAQETAAGVRALESAFFERFIQNF